MMLILVAMPAGAVGVSFVLSWQEECDWEHEMEREVQ